MPNVRTVVHLHGAEVEPESDGHPEAWFTRDFAQCGPRFEHTVYKYSNNQRPTTLWYHDHAMNYSFKCICWPGRNVHYSQRGGECS